MECKKVYFAFYFLEIKFYIKVVLFVELSINLLSSSSEVGSRVRKNMDKLGVFGFGCEIINS